MLYAAALIPPLYSSLPSPVDVVGSVVRVDKGWGWCMGWLARFGIGVWGVGLVCTLVYANFIPAYKVSQLLAENMQALWE